jgi:hypothetical protein
MQISALGPWFDEKEVMLDTDLGGAESRPATGWAMRPTMGDPVTELRQRELSIGSASVRFERTCGAVVQQSQRIWRQRSS